jgi:hypothetical protein
MIFLNILEIKMIKLKKKKKTKALLGDNEDPNSMFIS